MLAVSALSSLSALLPFAKVAAGAWWSATAGVETLRSSCGEPAVLGLLPPPPVALVSAVDRVSMCFDDCGLAPKLAALLLAAGAGVSLGEMTCGDRHTDMEQHAPPLPVKSHISQRWGPAGATRPGGARATAWGLPHTALLSPAGISAGKPPSSI
mmetsp:Transcript_14812/g.40541  ORF Transcript_14812/g.40541 Transcript_14812/m.40541 type:complete len:155 (-) Transcript_14812:20-484(-)